jgi:hypothetical protein
MYLCKGCLGFYVRMCLLLRRFAARRWLCESFSQCLLAMLSEIHGLILFQRVGTHLVSKLILVCPASDDVRHRLHHVSFVFCIFLFLWYNLILSLNRILLEDGDQAGPSLSFYLCLFLHQQGLNGFLVCWGRFLNEDIRLILLFLPNFGIYLRLEVNLIQRGAIWWDFEKELKILKSVWALVVLVL